MEILSPLNARVLTLSEAMEEHPDRFGDVYVDEDGSIEFDFTFRSPGRGQTYQHNGDKTVFLIDMTPDHEFLELTTASGLLIQLDRLDDSTRARLFD